MHLSPTLLAAAQNQKLASLWLVLGYLLLSLLLLRSVFITGEQTLIADPDGVWQSHAWLSHAWRAWQAGEIPFWDFTSQSGVSFIGELQTAPLYPLLIAFAAVATPGDLFWSQVFIGTHFFLAAVFMHLLLRELGLVWPARILGAIAFAFVGAVAWRSTAQPNLHASLVWLPLVVLLTHRALFATLLRERAIFVLAAGLALAQMVLAGHIHGYVHTVLALGLLTLIRPPRQWPTAIAVLALIGLGSIAASAVQILSAQEYLQLAYKWHSAGNTRWPHHVPLEVYLGTGIEFRELRSLFDPRVVLRNIDGGTLFSGRLVLLLALTAPLLWWLGRRGKQFEDLKQADLGRWLAFAGACALLALSIALADQGPLAKLMHATPLLSEVRQASRALHLFAFAMAMLAALGAHLLLMRSTIHSSRWLPVLGVAVIAVTAWEADRWLDKRFKAADTGIRAEQAYHGSPLLDQLENLSVENDQLYRYLSEPRGLFSPNLGNVRAVRHAQGYRSSMSRQYYDLLGEDWSLTGPVWDRFAVRWLITNTPMPEFRLLADDGDLRLYERPNVPPVFWTPSALGEPQGVDLASVQWRTNSVSIELAEPVNGLLVFAQSYFRRWQVAVEGERRRLSPHRGLLAVELQAGERHVEFYFSGTRFVAMLVLPIGMLLGLLVLLIFPSSREDQKTH